MSSYGSFSKSSGGSASRKRKGTIPYYPGAPKKAKTVKVVAIPRPKFSSRAMQGTFPSKKRVTLTYVEYFSQTLSVTGAASGVTIRLNGPFDPNQGGVGHQAMGMDQWSQFYSRYTVLSAKITFQAANIDSLVKSGIHGIVVHNPASTLPSNTDINALSEDDDGVHGFFSHDGTPSVLTKSVDIGKYFGITNPLEDDTLQALVTAVPSRQLNAYCWLACAPGTVTAGGLTTFMVRVSYDVMFTEPKDLPLS